MKRILIVLAVVAVAAFGASAQELPTVFCGGALFNGTQTAVPAGQIGVNTNIITKQGVNQKVKAQLSLRGLTYFADDYYPTEGTSELQALSGLTFGHVYYGQWSLGVGVGPQWEIKSGADEWRFPFALEVGWQPFEGLGFFVGGQYVPVGGGVKDIIFANAGAAVDWKALLGL